MIHTRDIHWLAGLLEGEGCFTLIGRKSRSSAPLIQLVMTDKDVMERAGGLLGKTPRGPIDRTYNGARPQNKPVYLVNLAGHRAVGWMMTLYPSLGVRRRQQVRAALVAWRHAVPASRFRRACPRGHSYDGIVSGRRVCTSCKSHAERRWRRKQRGYPAPNDLRQGRLPGAIP